MADALLTCTEEQRGGTDESGLQALRILLSSAGGNPNARHRVVRNPEEAEAIVFVEGHADGGVWGPYLEGVRATELYRKYRSRCVVVSGMDRPVPVVPGIYPSIPLPWHWRSLTRGGPYLVPANPFLQYLPLRDLGDGIRWLASFIGCAGAVPVRHRLARISDERILIRDNSVAFVSALRENRAGDVSALKRQFVETTHQSKFVLCPRGAGTSSIRLFEAMEMGRAPVILSDDWVPPEGPDWPTFSLRIAEREVDRLGDILREREGDAVAMGERARTQWDRWYSATALFDTIVDACVDLARRGGPLRIAQLTAARMQFLEPFHLRQRWRNWKHARARASAKPGPGMAK